MEQFSDWYPFLFYLSLRIDPVCVGEDLIISSFFFSCLFFFLSFSVSLCAGITCFRATPILFWPWPVEYFVILLLGNFCVSTFVFYAPMRLFHPFVHVLTPKMAERRRACKCAVRYEADLLIIDTSLTSQVMADKKALIFVAFEFYVQIVRNLAGCPEMFWQKVYVHVCCLPRCSYLARFFLLLSMHWNVFKFYNCWLQECNFHVSSGVWFSAIEGFFGRKGIDKVTWSILFNSVVL